jgi:hypothetical protein
MRQMTVYGHHPWALRDSVIAQRHSAQVILWRRSVDSSQFSFVRYSLASIAIRASPHQYAVIFPHQSSLRKLLRKNPGPCFMFFRHLPLPPRPRARNPVLIGTTRVLTLEDSANAKLQPGSASQELIGLTFCLRLSRFVPDYRNAFRHRL